MNIRTRLCDRFAIEIPVVQAPIGSATCPELAAAVSEAGALGTLSITWRSVEDARALIRQTRARTARPFAVNIVLTIDPAPLLAMCVEERVPALSFFWGDVAPFVPRLHEAGILVLASIGTTDEAAAAASAGADAIVAQGWEAGGHVRGTTATLPLVRAVARAVANVPIVAAGGIGDGRGLAAALMLGADGAWMGTRFVLAAEALSADVYRDALRAAGAENTCYSTVFDIGWDHAPHRALVNSTIRQWQQAGSPPAGRRPGEGEIVARRADGREIPRYSFSAPVKGMTGDLEAMAMYAGQSVGILDDVRPAANIVRAIEAEAMAALQKASEFLR